VVVSTNGGAGDVLDGIKATLSATLGAANLPLPSVAANSDHFAAKAWVVHGMVVVVSEGSMP